MFFIRRFFQKIFSKGTHEEAGKHTRLYSRTPEAAARIIAVNNPKITESVIESKYDKGKNVKRLLNRERVNVASGNDENEKLESIVTKVEEYLCDLSDEDRLWFKKIEKYLENYIRKEIEAKVNEEIKKKKNMKIPDNLSIEDEIKEEVEKRIKREISKIIRENGKIESKLFHDKNKNETDTKKINIFIILLAVYSFLNKNKEKYNLKDDETRKDKFEEIKNNVLNIAGYCIGNSYLDQIFKELLAENIYNVKSFVGCLQLLKRDIDNINRNKEEKEKIKFTIRLPNYIKGTT